jgi:hypothetical protein
VASHHAAIHLHAGEHLSRVQAERFYSDSAINFEQAQVRDQAKAFHPFMPAGSV